ncbi:M23 family metallopeptidase [Chryseomicrobium imtechense]
MKSCAIDFIKEQLSDFDGSGLGFGAPFRKTSSFGFRIHPITKKASYHAGDDYGAPMGTLIPAQAAGQVVQAAYHSLRGNYVRIKSGAMERIYQHNARNLVGLGQMIKPGQAVGTVGSTGASTGPHLHYEVLRNGQAINPKGLATGGIVKDAGMSMLAEEGYPEFVIPTAPNRRTDAMKLLALAAKQIMGGGSETAIRPNQLPNLQAGGSKVEALLEKLIELVGNQKTEHHIRITQEMVGRVLSDQISEFVGENIADRSRLVLQMRGIRPLG